MRSMTGIEVVLPARDVRRWMVVTIERLERAGYDVSVRHLATAPPWSAAVDRLVRLDALFLTRHGCPLVQVANSIGERRGTTPILRLDLTGAGPLDGIRTLTLAFSGRSSAAGIVDALVAGMHPEVTIAINGETIARAAPMIDNRASIAAGLEDVLARATTLAVAITGRVASGDTFEPISSTLKPPPPCGLARYLSVFASLAIREYHRRSLFRFAHWRTGYRLDGEKTWRELPDDGTRFFADPFPFTHQGRRYIFVEDFDHSARKGVISVSEFDSRGNAGAPRPVIEESTHLSYPQVFAHDGRIWMIPESSAAREVVLYRAEAFPDRWSRHAVLIADAEISDATLLLRDGHYWLFGTLRDGHGSTSDTLVVYHAPALTGPWTPHVQNPIRIDRAGARPAGAFLERDGRTFLPVQDGTQGYGSGIGLIELIELDTKSVVMGPRVRLWPQGLEPCPTIHTFNRHRDIEVIDWKIAEPRRRGARPHSARVRVSRPHRPATTSSKLTTHAE